MDDTGGTVSHWKYVEENSGVYPIVYQMSSGGEAAVRKGHGPVI